MIMEIPVIISRTSEGNCNECMFARAGVCLLFNKEIAIDNKNSYVTCPSCDDVAT